MNKEQQIKDIIKTSNLNFMKSKGWTRKTIIVLNHNSNTYEAFKDKEQMNNTHIARLLNAELEKVENYAPYLFNYEELELLIDSDNLEVVELANYEEFNLVSMLCKFSDIEEQIILSLEIYKPKRLIK